MEFPAEVRVGYKTFRVILVEPDAKADTHPLDDQDSGHTDPYGQTIHYREDSPPQGQANTILHECLHAILLQADVFQSPDIKVTEEHVVTCLANGLCQVIQDNPELWSRIQQGLAGGGPIKPSENVRVIITTRQDYSPRPHDATPVFAAESVDSTHTAFFHVNHRVDPTFTGELGS